VRERSTALYREACGRDLEGIVGKWARAHYLTDADIRQRDSRYRRMQDSALRALVRLLRDNAPDDEVGRDTFLREASSRRVCEQDNYQAETERRGRSGAWT
jgi:hypothetical protein